MAPQPNTVRLDQLEEQLASINSTLTERISTAVDKAMSMMKKTLAEELAVSLEQTSYKQQGELDNLGERLEGRITRSREHQEMLNSMKGEHEKFQSEMRSTLSEI